MLDFNFKIQEPEKMYNSYSEELQEILNKYLFEVNNTHTKNNIRSDIRRFFDKIEHELNLRETELNLFDISCSFGESNVSIKPKNLFTACILLHKYVPHFYLLNDAWLYTYPDGSYIKLENGGYFYYKQ